VNVELCLLALLVSGLDLRAVDDGIEYSDLSQAGMRGHVFRVDLDRVETRLLAAGPDRSEVFQLSEKIGPHLAFNASFFDEAGKAMGRVVQAGQVISKGLRKNWGALVIDGKRAKVMLGSELEGTDRAALVVQGLPRLLVDGVKPKLKPQPAQRTAVCAEDRYVFVVATQERVDANRLAEVLRDLVGCKNALNLDGGPSTQVSAVLKNMRLEIRGGWGVPNAIAFLPRR
jgi:uncharacterized protein YigE (DUF2233 family)